MEPLHLIGDEALTYNNEYDGLKDVTYNDEKFTGSFRDNREFLEYWDGIAHGLNVVFYTNNIQSNNTIQSIDIYDNGKHVMGWEFYKNGQLKSKSDSRENYYITWNKQSVVVKDRYNDYYGNGQPKKVLKAGNRGILLESQRLAKNGDVLYTVASRPKEGYPGVEGYYIYNDEAMLKHYYDLLICEDFELYVEGKSSAWGGEHFVWGWLNEIFSKDARLYFKLITALFTHPEADIRKYVAGIIVSNKFYEYIEPENENNTAIYDMMREVEEWHKKCGFVTKKREVNL